MNETGWVIVLIILHDEHTVCSIGVDIIITPWFVEKVFQNLAG